MKIFKSILISILLSLIFTSQLFAVKTDDIQTAYSMRMPIGGPLTGENLNLLSIGRFPNSGYPKILFNVDSDSVAEQNEWYVATAFNRNKWLSIGWNTDVISSYGDYHPAEDWNEITGGSTDKGEPVYAIADGIVLFNDWGFGNTVILVHKTVWGEYILSFYGHMKEKYSLNDKKVPVGRAVYRGDQIGQVWDSGSKNNYHLHFEIRRQLMIKIDLNTNEITFHTEVPCPGGAEDDICAKWWPKKKQLISKYYYNPSELIITYNTIARDVNGNFNQAIYDAYLNAGGYKKVGMPVGAVHNWLGITIQDFQHPDCPDGNCPPLDPNKPKRYYGDDGQSAILYNLIQKLAHLVHDGFWGVYKIYNGPELLGAPKTGEYIELVTNLVRQNFRFGYLTWDGAYVRMYTNSNVLIYEIAGNAISQPKDLVSSVVSPSRVDLLWKVGPEEEKVYYKSFQDELLLNSSTFTSVAYYKIFRDGFFLDSTTSTNYSDTSVVPDTEYVYEVSAVIDRKESTSSHEVAVTTPPSTNTGDNTEPEDQDTPTNIPPTIQITSPQDGTTVSFETLTVRGISTDDGHIVTSRLKINSGSWISIGGGTNWYKLITLNDGRNIVTVQAKDNNGNWSEEDSIVVTYSKVSKVAPMLPIVKITSHQNDFTTKEPTVILYGKGNDPNGCLTKFQMQVNGEVKTAVDIQYCSGAEFEWLQQADLIVGKNTITARVKDDDDNWAEATMTVIYNPIKIPKIPPTVKIQSPRNGLIVNKSFVKIKGTASDSDGSIAEVKIVGEIGHSQSANGTSNWSRNIALKEGLNVITVQAKDNDGLRSKEESVTVTYVKLLSPIVEITYPKDNWLTVEDSLFEIKGTASDVDGSVIEILFRLNNERWQTLDSTNNWSKSVTLVSGRNTMKVVAIDNDGLRSKSKRVIVTYNSPLIINPPENLSATPVVFNSKHQIRFVWDKRVHPQNVCCIMYRVYRNGKVVLTTMSTNYIDIHIEPGKEYCYQVSVVVDDYESDKSQTVCAIDIEQSYPPEKDDNFPPVDPPSDDKSPEVVEPPEHNPQPEPKPQEPELPVSPTIETYVSPIGKMGQNLKVVANIVSGIPVAQVVLYYQLYKIEQKVQGKIPVKNEPPIAKNWKKMTMKKDFSIQSKGKKEQWEAIIPLPLYNFKQNVEQIQNNHHNITYRVVVVDEDGKEITSEILYGSSQVPTMTEWGIIISMMLIMGLMCWRQKQPEQSDPC